MEKIFINSQLLILFAEYLSTVHSNKAENRRGTSKWQKEKAGTMIFLLFLKITSVMYREKTTAEVRESSAQSASNAMRHKLIILLLRR